DVSRRGYGGARVVEVQIRMIEEVEHFHAELEFALTIYAEALKYVRVHDSSARPAELVAMGVGENRRGDGRICRAERRLHRVGKRGRIEPSLASGNCSAAESPVVAVQSLIGRNQLGIKRAARRIERVAVGAD